MKKHIDVIAELSKLYFKKTGESPEYSFYAWINAIGLEENEKAWLHVLENPDDYEWI